jgi:DnaJ-class molecular chaperone
MATKDDIRSAYHGLSKIYHPNNPKTGDAAIFNRLTIFYESLTDRP